MSGDTSGLGFGYTGAPRGVPDDINSGSGTWAGPAYACMLLVEYCGGGAGGSSTAGATMCCGGKAAVVRREWISHTAGASYSYAVGAAGSGGASGAGSDGGDTTFGALPTAYGGKGPSANPAAAGTYGSAFGEDSCWGRGGAPAGGAANGYGAGGGGNLSAGTGGDGTGGKIRITVF